MQTTEDTAKSAGVTTRVQHSSSSSVPRVMPRRSCNSYCRQKRSLCIQSRFAYVICNLVAGLIVNAHVLSACVLYFGYSARGSNQLSVAMVPLLVLLALLLSITTFSFVNLLFGVSRGRCYVWHRNSAGFLFQQLLVCVLLIVSLGTAFSAQRSYEAGNTIDVYVAVSAAGAPLYVLFLLIILKFSLFRTRNLHYWIFISVLGIVQVSLVLGAVFGFPDINLK